MLISSDLFFHFQFIVLFNRSKMVKCLSILPDSRAKLPCDTYPGG
jgi:hypothetical protein